VLCARIALRSDRHCARRTPEKAFADTPRKHAPELAPMA
jgi:hypothetical protein